MLPTHNNNTAPSNQQSPVSIKHYSIKSSDVIDQRSRITVEDDEGVLWYKTRELTEHEIVDSLTDSKSNQTRWTVHQPSKRGWYLRLRSPLFPPGACIALTPPLAATAQHQGGTAAAPGVQQQQGGGAIATVDTRVTVGGGGGGTEPILVFGCQTIVPSGGKRASLGTGAGAGAGAGGVMSNRSSVDHSYPPSRSSISSQSQFQAQTVAAGSSNPSPPPHSTGPTVDTPSSGSPARASNSASASSPPKPTASSGRHPSLVAAAQAAPRWHVTHYTLQTGIPTAGALTGTHHHPHLAHPPTHGAHVQPPSFLHRLANIAGGGMGGVGGSGVHHFTIQPAGSGFSFAPSASASGTHSTAAGTGGEEASRSSTPPSPFIAFTDSTPILRATPSGTLSVDVERVRELGVEMAFWVAVSLAFWEFLREREGYLAASED